MDGTNPGWWKGCDIPARLDFSARIVEMSLAFMGSENDPPFLRAAAEMWRAEIRKREAAQS